MKVGDRLTLPSGRQALLTVSAVPSRPWQAVENGWRWAVVREHGIAGRPSVSFYFGGEARPIDLDESDARALAAALNAVG